MKKTYEVIHAYGKLNFEKYEDALSFAKHATTPIYDEYAEEWSTKYNRALIIMTEKKKGFNLEMTYVQMVEFIAEDMWFITDMKI